MKNVLILALGTLFSVPLFAQMHVVAVERLPLGSEHQWNQPSFSPGGTQIYFTDDGFNGIWEYSFSNRVARQITDSPRSGFGFALSADGKTISYRRTFDESSRHRVQELVMQDLSSGATNVLDGGESVSLPKFIRSSVLYLKGGRITKSSSTESLAPTALLGIEDTKIVLMRNGRKVMLDPLGNGSYIWPSLSPDGTKLLAYEIDRGTFISDLDGNFIKMLGRKDNPVWTRDGKWIVYMDDRDDGQNILSSDIYCISADGAQTVQLTNTDNVIELFPSCSPTEDKIACSTLSGDVYIITYSEEASR